MDDLVAIRQYLHAHPEVSGNEHNTQKYLLGLLEELNTDNVQQVGGTGILVTFKGNTAGRDLLLRGDIDALPIEETNDFSYRSVIKGVSHKCGHDGHGTIMYGLCKQYSATRPEKGDVYILFQPAEENGRGAKAVEDSGVLDTINIDLVFALHNVPAYPLHTVVCREGSFTPSVTTLIASFKGYTAHAAEPWNGRNPAAAMSEYLLESLKHNLERKDKHEFVTVTPVHTEMGELSYGVSAGEGSVHLTIRADSNERLQSSLEEIMNIGKELAGKYELTVTYEEKETFESNQNATEAVNYIQSAAAELKLAYQDKDEPFRWGEDFGLFTNRIKGAMFGVGSGEDCKPLHHPAYDFPDEILPTCINMFLTIQKKAQS